MNKLEPGQSFDCAVEGNPNELLQLYRNLYQLLASPTLDFQEQINCYIASGLEWLNMSQCVISRVTSSVYTVIGSTPGSSVLTPSDQISINDTLCLDVIGEEKVIAFAEIDAEKNRQNGYYKGQSVQSYIGGVLLVSDRIYGTVCFFDAKKRSKAFSATDHEVLKLILTGVARCIEVNSQLPPQIQYSPNVDQAAEQSVPLSRTLMPYAENSFGYQAVEHLTKRVGHSALSISNLSDDMSVSSRTLQRRLREHKISFGELRDHVRYLYAITHLVDKEFTIEGIAITLDFSDRTSFTSAFKRWTGLSPSTFRRVCSAM